MARQRFALLSRFFVALGLVLWLGGLAFFGAVAAPVLFSLARAHQVPDLAPRMVGAMLSRFSFVTYACALVLLLGWALEGWLLRDRHLLWKIQGALSLFSLGFAFYLGSVLLPQTIARQDTILPLFVRDESGQTLTSQERALLDDFDAGHRAYQRIARLNVYLLLAVLALLLTRSAASHQRALPGFAEREQSPQT